MTKEELIQEIWDIQQNIFDSCGMFSKEQALNESVELLEVYISKLHQPTVIKNEVAVCDFEWHEYDLAVHGKCGVCKERVK